MYALRAILFINFREFFNENLKKKKNYKKKLVIFQFFLKKLK